MFTTLPGFGDQVFTALVLILSAGITAQICHGYGTRKAKETFIGLILLLMVGVQFYNLINAATFVPASQFYVYNHNLHRSDCIDSGKGGKRLGNSQEMYDLNPCFCSNGNNCTIVATGQPYDGDSCPAKSDVASCLNPNGQVVHAYISKLRNCRGGQGPKCTKTQPCSPCELETIMNFGGERCRACSTENSGDCNFVHGVGPYCLQSSGSKKAVPCKTCCTPPVPIIVDGICY